ncbi:efflux RND transporter periplasmic adaptor subunit [Paradesertivirga mongoliensis]|uniref:Efflux RND transporter periplasmic adaptor subunit n=1 Tax=Paradesertivirga mongoliensis TaxID=2100740 RepID=A0ABW4ZPC5_9SPHI|nr:efflux RND transporter periplasmic adaptor subunit [Pedobacter mongoliensis]
MKKRGIITILAVVAVLFSIAWVLKNNKKKNAETTAVVASGNSGAVAVNTEKVTKSEVNLDFSSNGTFIANQDLTLSAENSGRVTRILVDEGSRVSKGQVVARIDADLLNVDVETARANYQTAVRDLERYESSFKTGGVTQQQLDNARLNVRTSKARLSSASIKSGDANIKAPISGIVNKRFIEQGSFVNPGMQLFEIVDVSKLKLKVTANETQVVNLKVGDRVAIKSNVFPNSSFSGRVSFIAPKADNSLNFPVEVQVSNNAGNQLKAGMYGTAVFDFPKQNASLTIPRTAFVGSVNSNKIYVLEGNKAIERQVTAGRTFGSRVEILDGLKEGETVITSGQINLVDGTEVMAVK